MDSLINLNADDTIRPPRLLSPHDIEQYRHAACPLPSITLSQRHLCDLELILNKGFSPLNGYLNQLDYHSVIDHMRLADGALWPMPIMLDVSRSVASTLQCRDAIALRDKEGLLLAIMQVGDIWEVTEAQKAKEAQAVFGTTDPVHPGVFHLYHEVQAYYVGGEVFGLSLPHHYNFTSLRHTPAQLRSIFEERGWKKIVGFQTRNPMHRAHQELTVRAAEITGADVILLHPVVGMTKSGDIEYETRVRCYQHILKTYTSSPVFLSLLPLAMRMAGPREAVWHALIRKNNGCTHFIVGRDHAGPGKDSQGNDFYHPCAAQELALAHQKEMGITIVPFQEMVFSEKQLRYFTLDEFPLDEVPASISGTELRHCIREGLDVPAWFSYPDVIQELRCAYPPKHDLGLTILLTGLPSSGKTTIAQGLAIKLRELTQRQVTLLDGDEIRTHLASELGFSREDRETNIKRVAFVAKEIAKHKGITLCALVAPFSSARTIFREMVSETGGFIEIYVSTPLSVCEMRDRKGLYKKARAGLVSQFTGTSDPYEKPLNPEISLDTSNISLEAAVHEIVTQIMDLGYIQQKK